LKKFTDLNDMMVFLAVVEQGSFTKAANYFALPKSNISRKISRLEESLSVRLLERSTRSLHLTEIGQVYYHHCQRIFEEMESAEQCVETLSSVPKGNVKVCASVSVGQGLLAGKLASFYSLFPQVSIDLRLTNRRVDIVEEGFDIAIRVGQSPDSALISKKLSTVSLNLYASPKYISQHHALKVPDDLANHACLYMSSVSERGKWQLSQQGIIKNVDLKPKFICDDFNVIKTMATTHAGIALLPDYLAEKSIISGALVEVLPQWQGRSIDIYAIYPSRKGVTPKIRVFLDYLAEQLN